jgi:hypothetical protein
MEYSTSLCTPLVELLPSRGHIKQHVPVPLGLGTTSKRPAFVGVGSILFYLFHANTAKTTGPREGGTGAMVPGLAERCPRISREDIVE